MDKFEEAMEKMSEMSEQQLNTLIEMEKRKICVCRECSTFNQCMGENKEGLFCILGGSNCKSNVTDCECSGCPLHRNFQLKFDSYCSNGSEDEQRKKTG